MTYKELKQIAIENKINYVGLTTEKLQNKLNEMNLLYSEEPVIKTNEIVVENKKPIVETKETNTDFQTIVKKLLNYNKKELETAILEFVKANKKIKEYALFETYSEFFEEIGEWFFIDIYREWKINDETQKKEYGFKLDCYAYAENLPENHNINDTNIVQSYEIFINDAEGLTPLEITTKFIYEIDIRIKKAAKTLWKIE